jgi:triosephosphate isomerase
VLCIGEALRDENGDYLNFIKNQLKAGLKGVTNAQISDIVIAYEPVWAIGTGEVAIPADAQEVCAAIRTTLGELYSAELADGVRILYGGSVKASNIASIMAEADVDGALVGGASLDPDEFVAICRYRLHADV